MMLNFKKITNPHGNLATGLVKKALPTNEGIVKPFLAMESAVRMENRLMFSADDSYE
jgi:hypothetical protein